MGQEDSGQGYVQGSGQEHAGHLCQDQRAEVDLDDALGSHPLG